MTTSLRLYEFGLYSEFEVEFLKDLSMEEEVEDIWCFRPDPADIHLNPQALTFQVALVK